MAVELATPQRFRKIAFLSSGSPEASATCASLADRYGNADLEEADVVVALGGDGLMLQTLHRFMGQETPIYGMNRGSVGFLMNDFARARPPGAAGGGPALHRSPARHERDGRGGRGARRHARSTRCFSRARRSRRPSCAILIDGTGAAARADRRRRARGDARRRGRPPTTCPSAARSSRSTPPSWRSRRSPPSARGAGAAPCSATPPSVEIHVLGAGEAAGLGRGRPFRGTRRRPRGDPHGPRDRPRAAARPRPLPRRAHPARAVRHLTRTPSLTETVRDHRPAARSSRAASASSRRCVFRTAPLRRGDDPDDDPRDPRHRRRRRPSCPTTSRARHHHPDPPVPRRRLSAARRPPA